MLMMSVLLDRGDIRSSKELHSEHLLDYFTIEKVVVFLATDLSTYGNLGFVDLLENGT